MGAAVSARGRGRGRRGFSDINVTPLVDVMLVLLIVFMVTAPLLTAGLDVDLPLVDARGAPAPAPEPVPVVTVTREGRVLLGEEDITSRVARALAADSRIQARKEVVLRADDGARYGAVAQVVAAARAAGVTGIHLLVRPER